MTKAELISNIAGETGLSKAAAEKALDALLANVVKGVKAGNVSLPGLGSFSVTKRKARKGRNPRTGEPIKIPASKTVKFKAAKALKDAVN
ncbi:MAG: HU family DNA-binding protein [Thermodesulfobacteriota bacterium]